MGAEIMATPMMQVTAFVTRKPALGRLDKAVLRRNGPGAPR
jgi:hypothetical protein